MLECHIQRHHSKKCADICEQLLHEMMSKGDDGVYNTTAFLKQISYILPLHGILPSDVDDHHLSSPKGQQM